MVGVVAGRVEDGDADDAVGVDCWRGALVSATYHASSACLFSHVRAYAPRPILPFALLKCPRAHLRLTIGMPYISSELHRRRHKRVIARELELGREDTALEGCTFGPLNQGLPNEQVILIDRACCDSLRWVLAECLVLLEEPLRCDAVHADQEAESKSSEVCVEVRASPWCDRVLLGGRDQVWRRVLWKHRSS